jgi:hypothetical protein
MPNLNGRRRHLNWRRKGRNASGNSMMSLRDSPKAAGTSRPMQVTSRPSTAYSSA